MSQFPQKRKVNVAAPSLRNHDMSHAHITSTDFGRMKIIECRYMVPGDQMFYNIDSVTRADPMPSPTFGQFDIITRGFFVPIRSIWKNFYNFISNKLSPEGESLIETYAPCTTVGNIRSMFVDDSSLVQTVLNPSSVQDYDFQVSGGIYYKFTALGRRCWDFITSSGCNVPLNGGNSDVKISVLPWIAFWKAYFDWIVPSRFVNKHSDNIEFLINLLNSESQYICNSAELRKYLIKEPLAYFHDDVFTSALENAFGSVDDNNSDTIITNPINNYADIISTTNPYPRGFSVVNSKTDGSYAHDGAVTTLLDNSGNILNNSAAYHFNQYTLESLGRLQDYLNRGLIAGSKVQDWLLTEFGLRPSTDALHLSTYLGSKTNTMRISDILSHSDTEAQGGVPLGAYGGFIYNKSSFDYDYKAKEHGYIILTSEIIPRTSYYQGLNPEFSMFDKFDFFQPEFDNLQGQPLLYKNLYFCGMTPDSTSRATDIFGFIPQYSLLKFAPDTISGDFRTRFGYELKSWYLARDIQKMFDSGNVDMIDEEFCLVKSVYQDWNYIWNDTSGELDHFKQIFYFNAPAKRPMESVTEAFDPTHPNGNKDVTLNFQGSVQ